MLYILPSGLFIPEFQNFRFLCCVLMLRTRIHMKLANHLPAKGAFRKHTLDCKLDEILRLLIQHFLQGAGLPGAVGHILTFSSCQNNVPYIYYFGTGWSRNPNTNFQSMADWEAYLSKFSQQVWNPLQVKI